MSVIVCAPLLIAMLEGLGSPPSATERRAHLSKKRQIEAPASDPDDAEFFAALDPRVPGVLPSIRHAEAGEFEQAWGAFDAWLRSDWQARAGLRGLSRPASRASLERAERLFAKELQVNALRFDLTDPIDWTQGAGTNAYSHLHSWRFFRDLGAHHRHYGDGRAATLFGHLADTWLAQRERITAASDFDAVWYELAVGGRATGFSTLLFQMREAPELDSATRRALLRMVLSSARHAHAQQAVGYTEGNWQVAGAGSLYELGLMWPVFRDSADWREVGKRRLAEHVSWDHDEDGGHRERTWGYGMGVVAGYHRFLSRRADDPEPGPLFDLVERRVRRTEDWFLKLIAPGGHMPGVHDSGSADLTSWLVTLAIRSGDGRFLWPIRSGGDLPKAPVPKHPGFESVHLLGSGYTVMRGGWEPNDPYLLVNWGRSGVGHIHSAILDLNIYAHGEPLLVEAGSIGYDHPLDAWCRSAPAHNQVVLEGAALAPSAKGARVPRWRDGTSFDYFEGYHDGYRDSAGVRLRRQIVMIRHDYWLVVDTVHRTERHETEDTAAQVWHAPRPFRSSELGLVSGEGPGVQLLASSGSTLELAVDYENENELYRDRYRATFRRPASNASRFVTVIAPFADAPRSGSVDVDLVPDGLLVDVSLGEWRDHFFVRTSNGTDEVGGALTTDGAVAWVREGSLDAFVVDGSRVRWRGAICLDTGEVRGLAETP